jgi:carrier protein
MNVGLTILMHPLQQAKFLMQVGHEPLQPKFGTNIFGTPVLRLPNAFEYVRHIKRQDGLSGCFRGCTESVCTQVAAILAHTAADRWLGTILQTPVEEEEGEPEDIYRPEDSRSKTESQVNVARRVARQAVCRTAAVVVSHPFHVIMCRTMVQFVGREVKYTGVFSSFRQVYDTDGIAGFFAGLVPRLVCDIATLVLVEYAKYWINRLVTDPYIKTFSPHISQMIVGSITYPFTVVSNCMAVNNCGLSGGLPPHMPIYNSWTDCYSHLKRIGQHNRGGSIFFRYYAKGPTAVILASSLKHGN